MKVIILFFFLYPLALFSEWNTLPQKQYSSDGWSYIEYTLDSSRCQSKNDTVAYSSDEPPIGVFVYQGAEGVSVSSVSRFAEHPDQNGYPTPPYFKLVEICYTQAQKKCVSPRIYDSVSDNCVCPSGMTIDSELGCRCDDGLELVIAKKCPCDDGDTCEYPPQCMEPCPDGTQRNEGGGCCPIGKIAYCDSSAQSWLCRCPYDQAEINGTCTICDGSYPNADASDCSNCPPYYETTDGQCIDEPCSEATSTDGTPAHFYYPISETSGYAFSSSVDGYTCYGYGDNSNTGTDSTGSSDNNNTNGGDSGDTGSGSDNNTTDGTNDNNSSGGSSGGSSGSGGSSSGSSGTGFSDEGIINQLRENKTVEESIKTSVDGVKTSVDNVKNTLDQTNNKLDSIKGAVDETNNKLDSIKNLLDSNVTFSFSGLTDQVQGAFNTVTDSINDVKTSFDNAKAVLEGGKTYTMSSGSFNGFHFEVWDKNIDFDPCPMLVQLRPFMTLLVQFMFMLWAVYILIWGFKK